jgi:ribosome maturation protein SDO1
MVRMDEAVIARLEKDGTKFEVLVDPDGAAKLRDGVELDITTILAAEEIFKDSHKGDRAAEENIKKVFGTTDILEVAKQIILHGEIQLTTEQRKKMQEAKRLQIIAYIARNAINPQTKAPHPPARIELAMKEAKVQVDPFKPLEVQVKDILDKLRPLIPIRFEKVKVAIRMSGEDYGKCYGDVKGLGTLLNEEWQANGNWIGVLEIPGGMQSELSERLNKKTKGKVEIKVLNR